jgi:hypothetical protein
MKTKIIILFAALVLSGAVLAWGQSAADMESLLQTGEINFSQAAFFVLASVSGSPPENPEAAFVLAGERNWLPAGAESTKALSLGELSLLMVRAFNLEGGLLYRIFPVSRYAYRGMISRGFIEGRSYSGSRVSGEQFLGILEKVLAEGETDE